MTIRRLVFLLRAWWTWRRGRRAEVPFCWGCGFIFPDEWYGATWPLTGVWTADEPHLCRDCKGLGWRFHIDGSGVYRMNATLTRALSKADRRLGTWY